MSIPGSDGKIPWRILGLPVLAGNIDCVNYSWELCSWLKPCDPKFLLQFGWLLIYVMHNSTSSGKFICSNLYLLKGGCNLQMQNLWTLANIISTGRIIERFFLLFINFNLNYFLLIWKLYRSFFCFFGAHSNIIISALYVTNNGILCPD